MDNKAIANLLYETADLLEIDGQDSFRIRSYRNAAQAIENLPQQIADLIAEPKKFLQIPGIGKGMLDNLQELFKDGRLALHAEFEKYHPSMLELLKIQGLGPKTIALIWSAYQVCDLDGVEKLAREGKIRELPRMGEKHEQKLLKAIEDYRRIGGRFLIDDAEIEAEKLSDISCDSSRHRKDHAGRIAAPRTRNRWRSRHSRHREPAVRRCRTAAGHPVHREFPPLMDVIARATTRSASACAAACRWMFACCRPTLLAPPCNTSRARRDTMSRFASAR